MNIVYIIVVSDKNLNFSLTFTMSAHAHTLFYKGWVVDLFFLSLCTTAEVKEFAVILLHFALSTTISVFVSFQP